MYKVSVGWGMSCSPPSENWFGGAGGADEGGAVAPDHAPVPLPLSIRAEVSTVPQESFVQLYIDDIYKSDLGELMEGISNISGNSRPEAPKQNCTKCYEHGERTNRFAWQSAGTNM